ncbi:putative subunit Rpb4 of RNA polymerase II [Hamiltosporidium tvaerminnensis]|uniref:Putative subunit Rpb4 of RNA polymerase II n=2 Tax=Hamiltosporidium TaxID=1176354 RepID=A0A4Q9M382_9MICR|nr:hypothetical protein LUQ84_000152 [Hamiltosporidium tvaerminnensis]TBU01988.1 putative subunit Rpb4 of RNA polymerase II [Hamiltosporidium tvaerminnensis]TBU03052.1 putative subunit Rpb4 of RNA polymerase II [Hamiltosporidium magnivora]TBU20478.1 putative subunit Rpb4 of RNA polymerase II [Hamiltosporidium tvaerminnensis]
MDNELEAFNSNDTHPVTVSEAKFLLETQMDRFCSETNEHLQNTRKIFLSTYKYLETFSKIKRKTNMDDLRKSLIDYKINEAEIALLGSLIPHTVEDTKNLIPSLDRLSDETLHYVLDRIRKAI